MDKWKRGITGLFMSVEIILPAFMLEGHDISYVRFSVQDKEVTYEEIKSEDIPKAVDESFKEYFVDYDINKAYISSEGSYKLEVSREEIYYILFYSEKGELLKVEQPEDTK